jgi:uncharacterized protein
MKIKIDDIPEDGLILELQETGETLREFSGFDCDLGEEIKAAVEIRKLGVLLEVSGNLKALVHPVCSMCLKDFELAIDKDFTERIVLAAEDESQSGKELSSEELLVNYFSGEELDTLDIISEQLALVMPNRPLCKEDCKGLCLSCGRDLNKNTCSCVKEESKDTNDIDPRLAKLKELKIRK